MSVKPLDELSTQVSRCKTLLIHKKWYCIACILDWARLMFVGPFACGSAVQRYRGRYMMHICSISHAQTLSTRKTALSQSRLHRNSSQTWFLAVLMSARWMRGCFELAELASWHNPGDKRLLCGDTLTCLFFWGHHLKERFKSFLSMYLMPQSDKNSVLNVILKNRGELKKICRLRKTSNTCKYFKNHQNLQTSSVLNSQSDA